MTLRHHISNTFQLSAHLLTGVLVVLTPLMVNDASMMYPLHNAPTFFSIKIGIVLAILSLIVIITQAQTQKISYLDVIIVCFLAYLMLRGKAFYHFLDYSILLLAYLSVRLLNKRLHLVLLLLLLSSALLQSIYGQLQLCDVFPSHHRIYGLSGSFFNPAPYAGYIAMLFPVALIIYRRYRIRLRPIHTTFMYFALACIVCILLVLPATRSRAAWVGLLVSSIISILNTPNHFAFLQKYKWTISLSKKKTIIIGTLVLSLFFYHIYTLKKDSANGRLLIWQASSNMVQEKPLFGWGKDGFESHYMLYQAKFFEAHPNHKASLLADNVQYAYNDPLKLSIEYGIVGLMLLLSLMYFIFRVKRKHTSVLCAKFALLALFVFSLFSYPSDILAIKINAMVLLAILGSYSNKVYALKPKLTQLLALITMCGILLTLPLLYSHTRAYHDALVQWRNASDEYRVDAYEECLEDFELAYPVLKEDGNFLVQYGKALSMANKDSLAIDVLEGAKQHLNNTILYTTLGDSYTRLGAYEDAEQAYQQAYAMVPNRFYPLYLLAKMYDESGQDDKAVELSQQILSKKIKVESRAIDEIKELAEEIINKHQ